MILGVDPGLRHTALALLDGVGLHYAELLPNPGDDVVAMVREVLDQVHSLAKYIDKIVVEWPRIYSRGPGNPNDLRALCAIAGGLCTLAVDVVLVEPRKWKGTLPKGAHHKHLKKRFNSREVKLVSSTGPTYLQHNVWDAVGLALYGLEIGGAHERHDV